MEKSIQKGLCKTDTFENLLSLFGDKFLRLSSAPADQKVGISPLEEFHQSAQTCGLSQTRYRKAPKREMVSDFFKEWIEKIKKLWSKVDHVLRSRSASKYLPMTRVFGPSRKCIFLSLLREHNCSFAELVKVTISH